MYFTAVFRNPSSVTLSKQPTSPQLVKKIPWILWNPYVHHCFHKGLLPVTILSQNNRVHIT